MRFLGVGDSCDLGALYLRLLADGHEVRVHVANPLCAGTLAGMVAHVPDWRAELDWVRERGADGIILFENVAGRRGAAQDALRAEGFNVVGGSAYGDRLENDRLFAQTVLAEAGLPIAQTWEFACESEAAGFIARRPARYVLKFNGPGFASSDNYVGRLPDGRDVRAVLAARLRAHGGGDGTSFVLMEHVDGVEMGVGAYFNGHRFLRPACLDWEHKRFFAGDMGELTGEMGTVVTYARTAAFFARTLGRLEARLREAGHCGYVNLNTIVNAEGIWPLEFTCRFGYPGYAILDVLQQVGWAELFAAMTRGQDLPLATRAGFAVGVVLTTPPFPYTRADVDEEVGLPILLDPALDSEDRRHLLVGEMGLADGALVTSGMYGWTMVATGLGDSVAAAKREAYRRAAGVFAPSLRYRLDIGDRLIADELDRVEQLGLLDRPTPA